MTDHHAAPADDPLAAALAAAPFDDEPYTLRQRIGVWLARLEGRIRGPTSFDQVRRELLSEDDANRTKRPIAA